MCGHITLITAPAQQVGWILEATAHAHGHLEEIWAHSRACRARPRRRRLLPAPEPEPEPLLAGRLARAQPAMVVAVSLVDKLIFGTHVAPGPLEADWRRHAEPWHRLDRLQEASCGAMLIGLKTHGVSVHPCASCGAGPPP